MGKYGGKETKDGDNTKYMAYLQEITMLSLGNNKLDLESCSAEELTNHVARYFQTCEEHDQRAGLSSFALSLGLSRRQLMNLLAKKRIIPDANWEVLMMANNMLGTALEDGMVSGTSNVVGSIFVAKNNFGYKDQTEQLVIHEDRRLTKEELIKIADTLPDVVDGEYSEITDLQIEDKAEDGKEEIETDGSPV